MTEPSEAPADVERAAHAEFAARHPVLCESASKGDYRELFCEGYSAGFAASAAERERLGRKAEDAVLLLRAVCLGVVEFVRMAHDEDPVPELSTEMRSKIQSDIAKALALSSGQGGER